MPVRRQAVSPGFASSCELVKQIVVVSQRLLVASTMAALALR